MTNRPATTAEVRKSYKDAGHTVRISKDGHIEFKQNGEGIWREGCWVQQYRTVEDDGTVETYLR